jgi:hypothetical protein
MTKLKPWYTLDINVQNAVRADFDLKKFLEQKSKTARYNIWWFGEDTLTDFYSTEWLEYMQSLDLPVVATLVFWREANYQHSEIHIDAPHRPGTDSGLSLNWCIGPDTSAMSWYKTPDIPGTKSLTQVGSNYYYWPADIGEEIDRHIIGSVPTLVRVDIPHNVIMGPEPRLCVSCRINFKIKNWEQAVAKMEKFIKE